MSIYERVSGARMHAAYFRIGGVSQDIPGGLLNSIYYFVAQFKYRLSEIVELLDKSRIWRQRLVGVGSVSKSDAVNLGHTGVLLRSTGVFSDLRQTSPYENYSDVKFQTPVGMFGDSYDRYVLRVDEMFQSISIIQQSINNLSEGPYKNIDHKITPH
jgi:NADH dehydrogenase (ubiquinone) Fe-S protein 2